jgi:Tfp pilus assembly protein PilO
MDFENVLKVLVSIAVMVAIPVAAYAAIAATRSIWGRPQPPEDQDALREVETLRARVQELESMQHRMAELEERLDFTERLLVQQRDPARLPEGNA